MIRIPVFSVLLLTAAPCLLAGEALVVTLPSIGDRVRSQNLELRAARHAIDEALGLHKQAGRLQNPELDFSLKTNDRNTEPGFDIGFNQKFPVTGRLRLEKQVGATQVEAARKEVDLVENRLVGEARSLLVELLALRGRQKLLAEQAGLLDQLAGFTAEAAERAEASPIDVGQAKLEKARIDAECLRLEAEIKCSEVEIKPLLGMQEDEELVISGELPGIDPPPAAARGTEPPSVALARLEVQRAEQLTELEQALRYEDVKVGIFAGVDRTVDAPGAPENEGMIGLRVMMPLPLWNNNEGNIEAARAVASRRKGELQALEQRLALETATLREEMQRWALLATEIETKLLPLADAQTTDADKAWRNGQVSLLSVLKSREQGIELAVARLDALKNYHLARVRYLKLLGDS